MMCQKGSVETRTALSEHRQHSSACWWSVGAAVETRCCSHFENQFSSILTKLNIQSTLGIMLLHISPTELEIRSYKS